MLQDNLKVKRSTKLFEILQAENGQFYYVIQGLNINDTSTSKMYDDKNVVKGAIIDIVNAMYKFGPAFIKGTGEVKQYAFRDWRIWATDKTLPKAK